MKLRFINHGFFRARYLFLILIVLYLPIGINGFVLYKRALDIEVKERLLMVRHMMDQSAEKVQGSIREMERSMDDMAEHNGIRRGLEVYESQDQINQSAIDAYIEKRLNEMVQDHPIISELYVLTLNGRGFGSKEMDLMLGSDVLENIQIKEANTPDQMFMLTQSMDRETDVKGLYLIRAIRTLETEAVNSYIIGLINIEALLGEMGPLNGPYLANTGIFIEDGGVFIAPNSFEIDRTRVVEAISEEINSEVFDDQPNPMDPRIQVVGVENTPMYLVSRVDESQLMGTVKKTLQKSYLLLLHITLTTSFVLVMLFVLGANVLAERNAAQYQYELSEEWNHKWRVYKHDLMNHIQVIQSLVELDYKERALEHIRRLATEGDVSKERCNIGIPEIESAIFTNLTPAKEAGYKTTVDCIYLGKNFPYDPFDVVKVLSNLIRNAVQALEQYESPEKELRVRIHKDEHYYYFSVKNSGPLISEDIEERIFDKGFSTNDGRGRGLGLYIVQCIVDKNNGYVNLEVDASGNLFTVMLPV